MRFVISTLVLLIVAIPAVLFATSNRDTIVIQVWPLPFEILIYVHLLVFIPLVAGLFVGFLYAWLLAGKYRRRAREASRQARIHERRVQELESELEAAKPAEGEASVPATTDRAAA